MTFSFRQIQVKYIEQNIPLYMIFDNFTKAFDTVNILRKLGCLEYFVWLVAALHAGMKVSVSLKELSKPFEDEYGVKQGCVLAPILFSIFLSMVLSDAFTDCNQEVWIQRRPGANLFNASQFKSAMLYLKKKVR